MSLFIDWRPRSTMPDADETRPFLVKVKGNSICKTLVLQVSLFEGRMYPDHMDGSIDWADGIASTDVIAWAVLT